MPASRRLRGRKPPLEKSLPRNWAPPEPRWGWSSSCAECFHRPRRMAVGYLDRIVQVGEYVAHIFDTDRQPHQLRGDPSVVLLLDTELRMGGGGGVDHQRLGVADIRQQ